MLNLVKREPHMRIIKTKWVFRIKKDAKGNIVRYKSRLVALGNQQRPGLDYDQTYSPVVKARTTRILTALAVENDWEIDHEDVFAAYLAGTLKEDIFIELPEGYLEFGAILANTKQRSDLAKNCKSRYVCKLNKGLYGPHQSGLLWHEVLRRALLSIGLLQSKADPCVFYCPEGNLIITTYVDDLVYYGLRNKIDWAKAKLANLFDIRDLGPAKLVQSINIVKNNEDSISINQRQYTKELLKEFGMTDCKSLKTPGVPGEHYTQTKPGEELEHEVAHEYRRLIGSLLYHTERDQTLHIV